MTTGQKIYGNRGAFRGYLCVDFAGDIEEAMEFAAANDLRSRHYAREPAKYNPHNGCVILNVGWTSVANKRELMRKLDSLGWDKGSVMDVKTLTQVYGRGEWSLRWGKGWQHRGKQLTQDPPND